MEAYKEAWHQCQPAETLSSLGQGNVSILKTTTMCGKWQKFWVSREQQQQQQSPKEPRTVAGGAEAGTVAEAEAETG